MKNLLITIVFLLLGINASLGQKFSTEYEKVGKDDIELKTYANDKNAEAVVLFNKATSFFLENNGSFDIVFEHTKRIKILSEAGLKYAEVEIPYYQEGNIYERINYLTAYTYNFEDGRLTKTPLNLDDVHDEKLNEYWMLKKFAMPNVKVGSIIEFNYTLTTPYVFNLRDWNFQEKIPTIHSEYLVRMIPFYDYSYILQGVSTLDSHESYVDNSTTYEFAHVKYKNVVHKFEMNHIPAFESEEYITSMNDYVIKIDFQLAKIHFPNGGDKNILSTWPEMIETLTKHNDFGKYIKKCEKIAPKIIDTDAIAKKPKKERFEEVVSFVKNNFNWNKYNAKYASKSAGDVVDDKFGNAADINLLTIGLLKAVGIDAYPLLISTRSNGKVLADYPYSHFFNYVLIFAKLDDTNVLSDATETNNSIFRIPPRCINDKGLLIDEDSEVTWIGLQSRIPSETSTLISLQLKDNKIEARVTTRATEYEALELRNDIGRDIEKLNTKLSEKNYTLNTEKTKINESAKPGDPYQYEFTPEIALEEINNKIYISPFLNEPIDDNPFHQVKRTYPIDMVYPWKQVYISKIEIPENYTLDFIPERFVVRNDLAEIEYTIMQNKNDLTISFSIYFKKSVYSPEDYSKIKFYFNEIVKKGNEKVVLINNGLGLK